MKIKEIATFNPKGKINSNYINYIDTSSVIKGNLLSLQKLHGDFPSRAQRMVELNDILISSVRPNLEHNYLVNIDKDNLVASTGFIQIRANDKLVHPRYLYYFLTTCDKVSLYSSIADSSQTTFPAFSKEVIENIEFPQISLISQLYIVDTIHH